MGLCTSAQPNVPRRRWAGAARRPDRGQCHVQRILQIIDHHLAGRGARRKGPILRHQRQVFAALRHLHRVVYLPLMVHLPAVADVGTLLLPQLRYPGR